MSVQFDAHRAGEHQWFIVGYFGCLERVPCEHEPRSCRVELLANLGMRQLPGANASLLAAQHRARLRE
jgi:hypothetical protein